MYNMNTKLENSDARECIYKPIEELFQTPCYKMSQQCCWSTISYTGQTAAMTELLRLQENNQLPSSVSGEDMMNLIEDRCKSSLRVQLWKIQLEPYDNPEFLPLLNLFNLVWEVSNSLKKRDIEFEARQFLKSPKARPPKFRDPSIIRLAQEFSSILKEQQQKPLTSKHLGPQEVVLEVVPKVLQGFWLPPEDTCLNMPSKHLSVLAVSLTQAVVDKVCKLLPSLLLEVSFTRSTRDKLVQSIQDSVRRSFTRPVLMEKISCFAVDLMNSITTITTKNICELFQPQISTKEPNTVAEEVKQEPHQESAFTPPPPAPHVSPPAEPAVVLEVEGLSQVPTIPPDPVCPVINNMKTTMEKSNATKGIYKPIKELFQMPIYEISQQCCWHTNSYTFQTAVMTELLRLQENNQLPSSVSVEDMMNLIQDRCKSSLRVQNWQLQLEEYKDPEFLPLLNLLNLVWEVSNSLKKRDIEFEARQFLKSPKARHPQFSNPSIIRLAQEYSSILKKQQQQPLTSKHLVPPEVVLEVVPKVLQGFWLPPEDTCLNMPSQHLSVLAVSLTQAVEDKVSKLLPSLLLEVSFTRSTRDKLVHSIQDSVRRSFTRPVLMEKISCFAVDLMNSITTIATKNICELFQPQISTKEPNTVAEEVKQEPHQESAFTPPPPASPVTPPAEPAVVLDGEGLSQVPTIPPDPVCPVINNMKTTLEKSNATKGIYKPIKELFKMSCYKMSQQCCWHSISYMGQTAIMTELLRLQENNQLPSSVSGEDMMNLIQDRCKSSLRVQNWQLQLEEYKDPEFLPLLNLLNLVWEVSNSLKKRDIEFEARQFLKSPKARHPQFSNPRIIRLAQEFSSILKEQQQQPLTSKHLGPQEVVLEVVPKVLQGFWLPPEDTCLNMPSKHLIVLAVSLTQAVEDKVSKLLPSLLLEVNFNRSTRDKLVQSIQDSVRRSFTRPVLMEKISCFAVDLLNSITTITTKNICELFQPQISTKEPKTIAEEVKQEPHQESAFTPPPPAPPVTPPAEPAVVLEGEGLSQVPTIPPDPVCPFINNMKTTMEKSDATKGIYKPIKELFQLSCYEMSQQCCWHTISYMGQTAVMTELLRLQENNQLPSSVSGEDMMNLIEEESNASLRVQNWQLQLEEYKDPEFLPLLNLLNLVWEVSNSLKKRDIEFEARQFLKSPKTRPPQFRDPRIISLAQEFSSILKEQQQQPLTSKHLVPPEVVLEVVPKVLQGFWLPPEDTCLNMPSQHLSVLAVSLTQAVVDKVSKLLPSLLLEVSFTRSTRDKLVQSIQDSVRRSFTRPVLMEKIRCFAVDLMKSITTIATKNICELFQPQVSTKEPFTSAEEVKQEPHQESAFTPPPPAPPVTPPAEPAVVLEGEGLSHVPTIPPAPVTRPVVSSTEQKNVDLKAKTQNFKRSKKARLSPSLYSLVKEKSLLLFSY